MAVSIEFSITKVVALVQQKLKNGNPLPHIEKLQSRIYTSLQGAGTRTIKSSSKRRFESHFFIPTRDIRVCPPPLFLVAPGYPKWF